MKHKDHPGGWLPAGSVEVVNLYLQPSDQTYGTSKVVFISVSFLHLLSDYTHR